MDSYQSIHCIIKQFKNLDLSKYPIIGIHNLFSQVGTVPYLAITLRGGLGKFITRARINENDERYCFKYQMSCRSDIYNKGYQRASTPKQNMFYATISPGEFIEGDPDDMRVVGVAEQIPFWHKSLSGYQDRKSVV